MNDVDVIGQSTHGQNFYVTLPKELTPDLENFKTWLSQNPLIVDYVLDEPVTEPLPESVQQQLQTLKTYYPTTVITVDGGEVVPSIEATYTADTKNYIDGKVSAKVANVLRQYQADTVNLLSLMPTDVQATMIENDQNNLLGGI